MQKKILVLLFTLIIGLYGFSSLFNFNKISKVERRYLASFPSLLKGNQFNEGFFDDLDKYLSDHMWFKDGIRKIKMHINYNLLKMNDVKNIYQDNGYLFEIIKLNQNNIIKTLEILNQLNRTVFKESDVHFLLIPFKNAYLSKKIPGLRFEEVTEICQKYYRGNFKSLKNDLSLNDYYKTDIHWDAYKIEKIADLILNIYQMEKEEITYEIKEYESFYGSLANKLGFSEEHDILRYLDSSYFEKVKINSIEDDELLKVYDKEALDGLDPYNVFLNGPKAYLKINNENQNNREKLVVIRDSFASSIIPYLIPSFSEIEVIDLRYYHYELLKEYPKDTKVLFLLGTEVMNSGAIK